MGVRTEIKNTKQEVVLAKSFENYRIFLMGLEDKEYMVHEWLEIVYIVKGKIELTQDREIFELKEKDLYIFNPATGYLVENKGDTDEVIMLVLQVRCDAIRETLNIMKDETILISNMMGDSIKENIIEVMGKMFLKAIKDNVSKDEMEELYEDLVSYLITKKYYPKKTRDFSDIDSTVADIAKEAAYNYVDLCKKNITLEDMADQHNISYYYLSRTFKKNIGMNYTDYLLRIRLNKAIDLIMNTDEKITKIAEESGFSNIKSFNNAFRKTFSMSPTEFRRTHRDINNIVTSHYLYNDDKVKMFLNVINVNMENTLDETYEYNINANAPTLIKRRDWSRITDINSLFDISQGFENFKKILENVDCRGIIMNLRITRDQIYIFNRRDVEVPITKNDFNSIINMFNRVNIYPIIFLNYDIAHYETKTLESFEESVKEELEVLSEAINLSKLQAYVLGIRIRDMQTYLRGNKETEVLSVINIFKELVSKKFKSNEYRWAIHFDNLDNTQDLENIKRFIEQINVPDFSMVNVNYNNNEPKYDYAINYYINMLNELNMYLESFNIKNKLLVSFNYILDNLGLDNSNKINFVNLFMLNLSLKIKSNDYILASTKLSGDGVEDDDLDVIDRYFFNDIGLRLPPYYTYDFLNLLGEDLIYADNGIFVTRSDDELIALVYYDYLNYYNHATKIGSTINNLSDINYKLNISGLSGAYKISEYKVNLDADAYSDLYFEDKYKASISEWEKKHLDHKYILDVDINFEEIDGEFAYKGKKKIMDIQLISLNKIE